MSANPFNIVNNVEDLLFPGSNTKEFLIYTNNVLGTDSQVNSSQQDVAIRLTTFMDFHFRNSVNFAWEPIEGGKFNVDSVQDNPFNITILGVCAPLADSEFGGSDTAIQQLNALDIALDKYMKNTTLLTIIQQKPLFKYFKNIKLIDYNYRQIAERPGIFYGHLTFQEARIANFSPQGSMSVDQVSNPSSASTVNTGLKAPTTANSSENSAITNNSTYVPGL